MRFSTSTAGYVSVAGVFGVLSVFASFGTLDAKENPVNRVSQIEPLQQARDFACCPLVEARYVFDFNESSNGYYTMPCGMPGGGEPAWEWGPVLIPPPIVPDVACDSVAVTNLLGTVLDGMGFNDMGERAVIGPVVIEEDCSCMELCHHYFTQTGYECGNVKVSADDGVTWYLITPARGYDGSANCYDDGYWPKCVMCQPSFTGWSEGFIKDCFDLSSYLGQEILVGFDFGSDQIEPWYGWYIKWVKFGAPPTTAVERVAEERPSWGAVKVMYR